jgi:flagellar biosynthesis chaperone FliJ
MTVARRRPTPHPIKRKQRLNTAELRRMNTTNMEIAKAGRIVNNFEKRYKKVRQLEKNVESCKKDKEMIVRYGRQLRNQQEYISQLESVIDRLQKIVRE